MSSSIGDFALNIIPKIDMMQLNTGITALDSLSNLASKIAKGFKGAFDVVDDTAESLRNLAYAGKELSMPVAQIKLLENTMKLFGLNAQQAVGTLKTMKQFQSGAIFGQIPTDLIMKSGLTPMMFGNDWVKNMEMLSRVYASNTNASARQSLNQIFGAGIERMLTDPAKLKQYINEARATLPTITDKNLQQAELYTKGKGDLSIAMDNLALALTSDALPGLTEAITGLTTFLNSPMAKEMFHITGKVLGGAGKIVGQAATDLSKGTESTLLNSLKQGSNPSMDYTDIGNAFYQKKEDKQQPTVNVNVEFDVKSDGTSVDIKHKEQSKQVQKRVQQTGIRGQ
jgi:hypothetical protein